MSENADLGQLAGYLRERRAQTGERIIVGIAGTPGTGKSTFAEQLSRQFASPSSVIVPMDGFHLAKEVIRGTSLEQRRGAIDTFDADGYVSLLRRIRARNEAVVYAPSFRRGLEEPIAASIPVRAESDFVITEGNYLLADVHPWNQVADCLDEIWYVEVSRETRMKRLIERHMRFGMTAEQATAWAIGTDEVNARFIESTKQRADRIIQWR